MKTSKKIAALLSAAVLSLGLMSSFAFAASPIRIDIDGKTITSDTAPVVQNGTALVPVKVVSENLGAEVTWNQVKKQVTVQTAGYRVIFTINSNTYTVNGASKTLATPARIINGKTMIPLKAIAESIGAAVDYNSSSNTVTIKYFTGLTGSLKVSGSTTVQPIMQAAADKLIAQNKGLSITVAGGGSGAGIKDTINGANNVGMSSRSLTPDETSKLNPYVVADDGIAIIVNPNNPVKNLTKDQAAKIFLGEIKNWKDVGGNNAPILVQTRETGSGTLTTLEEMLLNKAKVVSTATPYTSSALLKQAVAKNENAIGFDSVGYVDSSVKALTLNGIVCNPQNIKNGAYPMSRQLYVFTKGRPAGISAKLIDYLRATTCQNEIVSKEGYVPFR